MKILNRKTITVLILFVAILSGCIQKQKSENWIQLFNGKDLNDWQIKFKGYEVGVQS